MIDKRPDEILPVIPKSLVVSFFVIVKLSKDAEAEAEVVSEANYWMLSSTPISPKNPNGRGLMEELSLWGLGLESELKVGSIL